MRVAMQDGDKEGESWVGERRAQVFMHFVEELTVERLKGERFEDRSTWRT